jgi:hypothetical protein
MIVVGCMTVPIVHIVHVITMLYGFVPARISVLVIMTLMHRVHTAVALIPMVVVRDMGMAIVQVIDMISVLDRGMAALLPMRVQMIGVNRMGSGGVHGVPPPWNASLSDGSAITAAGSRTRKL